MVTSSNERKIRIKSIGATVIGIILLTLYFINDFAISTQIINAGIHAVMIFICIKTMMKKRFFNESIYTLILMFLLEIFIINGIPYLDHADWFITMIRANIGLDLGPRFGQKVMAMPYLRFYLIGLVLLIIAKASKDSYFSERTIHIMEIAGKFSFWAMVLHICAACSLHYEILESITFFVFMISAFWEMFTAKVFRKNSVWKASALTLLIWGIEVFYGSLFIDLTASFQRLYYIEWYYLLGLFLISCICILSEDAREDNIIGISFLATMIILFFQENVTIILKFEKWLFFHIIAISAYQCVWYKICLKKSEKDRIDHRLVCAGAYFVTFLLTVFIQYHLMRQ